MASTRSIVATLVILAILGEFCWKASALPATVCETCETIPEECYGVACFQIASQSPGQALFTMDQNSNVAKKVCVSQGDFSNFILGGCTSVSPLPGGKLDAATGTCPSKTFLYTKDNDGNRYVLRFGATNGGLACGAQRGFCSPGPASPTAYTIDTSTSPWKIKSGTWSCTLTVGAADNKWQLSCL